MMMPFTFKRSSVRAGHLDNRSPIRPRLRRLFGSHATYSTSVQADAIGHVEDHDLNDVGLVRGAVPPAVWEWRRRSRDI